MDAVMVATEATVAVRAGVIVAPFVPASLVDAASFVFVRLLVVTSAVVALVVIS